MPAPSAFTVTFSEPVTGVNPTDFQVVTTGTVGDTLVQVTPPGPAAVYTVTVSGITGNGTLGLNLVDNGNIRDLAGNPLTSQNSPAAFQAPSAFVVGPGPAALALGDVNGDGIPDLVTANADGGTISVLLGNGNGTYQTPQTFSGGLNEVSLVMGDVNGDGTPDIVVACNSLLNNNGPNDVIVLLGNGNGTFQAAQTFNAGLYPNSVALGDVNGDGKPDIVVANDQKNGIVSLLLGNGTGSFQSPQTFFAGSYTRSVALGDSTGDGKLDIVAANESNSASSGSTSVLLGNGNGTFQAQQTFATGAEPEWVVFGDVNGDGHPDLVVSNHGSNTVSVLLGNGNGTFQSQQTFGTGVEPFAVALSDVNGDGAADIVALDSGYSSVSVLLGNGNGTFQAQHTFITGPSPQSLAVSDVTRDGKADILVASYEANTVIVLLGNGNGTFQTQGVLTAGFEPHAVAFGDLDGNGTLDLAVDNENSDTVSVLLGNGNGTFEEQQTFATGGQPDSVALADLTGDGRSDIIVANKEPSYDSISVLLGNGNGTFQVQQTYAVGFAPTSVVVSDVNGDGKPDLVVGNLGGTVSVLLGNGNGTFRAQQTFHNAGLGVDLDTMAVADLNGDGIPDVVTGAYRFSPMSVLLGNGNGTFQAPLTIASQTNAVSVALGDLSGDGKLDLVSVGSSLNAAVVQLGNGNGTFQAPQAYMTGANPDSVVIGDLNGDGKLDLIVASNRNSVVSVLMGNGNGTFQAQQLLAAGYFPYSLALADVNGDDRPDLIVADAGYIVSVLLNAVNGNFTGQVYTVVPAAVPNHFVIAGPSDVTAGNGASFTIVAEDQLNNTITGYAGTVQFGVGDPLATFPGSIAVNSGLGTFSATLSTAGDWMITATDTSNATLTGVSGAVAVAAAYPNRFLISVPTNTTAGVAFRFTVLAEDPFNNTATNYTGTVSFSSSDLGALYRAAGQRHACKRSGDVQRHFDHSRRPTNHRRRHYSFIAQWTQWSAYCKPRGRVTLCRCRPAEHYGRCGFSFWCNSRGSL